MKNKDLARVICDQNAFQTSGKRRSTRLFCAT